MSRENVEIVRAVYDAAARHDPAAVFALYDPEVEWDFSRHPISGVMSRRVHHGHDGLRSWWREWRDAWESVVDECEELIDAGEHVISVVTSRGLGRGSGVEVELQHAAVWTLRDGKIVRVSWLLSREEALEAVGLRK